MKKRPRTILKEERRHAWLGQRRKEASVCLTHMGIWAIVESLPAAVKERIVKSRHKPIKVVIDSSVEGSEKAKSLRGELEILLNTKMGLGRANGTTVELSLSAQELESRYMAIQHALARVRPPNERVHELLGTCTEKSASFIKAVAAVLFERVADGCLVLAARASSLDDRLFWIDTQNERQDGVTRQSLVIGAHRVKAERAFLDGERRDIYRLAQCIGQRQPQQVYVDARLLGEEQDGDLPVYVQRHTLERLRGRLGPLADTAQLCLWTSLMQPTVIAQEQPGRFLIEYLYLGAKLGYLGAVLHEEKLILTTFLFLTMEQTPESRKLAEMLKLKRLDMEYNRLTDVKTFMSTDLLDDPLWAAVFRQCGCDGLFSLREWERSEKDTPVEAVAANLKGYLRFDKRREGQLLARLASGYRVEARATKELSERLVESESITDSPQAAERRRA